jgi:hypothetical protein
MIPNPFGETRKVIYQVRGADTPKVYVYGPSMMQYGPMGRRRAAIMLTRIHHKVLVGKGTVIPRIDGWEYRP